MSKLGTGIDKLDVDWLQMSAVGVLQHSLTKNKRSLLGSDNTTLEHDPVLVDLTVLDESTHWGDTLLGQISSSLARSLVAGLSDAVDLLVDLSTMEVSVLTGTWDGSGDTGRMPRSNTGNLSQTTMGLTRKTRDTPTSGDTLETVTSGNSDDINLVVLGEDRVDSELLLEERLGKVNLGLRVGSSVDLDLHDVGLLDTKVELLDLGVGNDTDNSAELGDTVKLVFNVLSAILLVLKSILGVSLFLGLVPVLVTTTLELFTQMLSKDSGQGAETTWSLDVSNNTNDNHRWGLNDGDSVNDFTLVHEGTRTVDTTDNVCHTSLVTAESGKVAVRVGAILWEMAHTALVVLGSLLGQETQVTMSRSFELTVRPVCSKR